MVAKEPKHDRSFYFASSPTSGTFDSMCVSTDKRTPPESTATHPSGDYLRANPAFWNCPNNSLSPHSSLASTHFSDRNIQEKRKRDKRKIDERSNSNARQAGMWAGLVVWSGPRPARVHHSRRREFCCLEPGAGGGKGEGWSQATLVPRRVSKLSGGE